MKRMRRGGGGGGGGGGEEEEGEPDMDDHMSSMIY
jgi:hypothetical protein